MIGTVPPSALHAAPVTYDERGRAQKDDHRGDLARLGEPAERPPRADLREHLVAVALLVGESAVAEPRLRRGRAGSHGVAADPVLRVEVGDEAREGQHRRLHDRVVRHPGRRALSRPSTRRSRSLRSRARASSGSAARVARTALIRLSSHDRLPVGVGRLVEPPDPGAADVVTRTSSRPCRPIASSRRAGLPRPARGRPGHVAASRGRVVTPTAPLLTRGASPSRARSRRSSR